MGRRIPSDYVGTGINSDILLDDYVRCSRCNFINKLSRDVRALLGSRAGWGMIYQRQFVDTFIANGIVVDSSVPIVSTGGRIVTEEGFAILSEDGQVLIEETGFITSVTPSTSGDSLTFGGDPLTFGGDELDR